jgi:hypothetical protein
MVLVSPYLTTLIWLHISENFSFYNPHHFFAQQNTRVERVIGSFLVICGILFYFRLLSAMTEQFRVS